MIPSRMIPSSISVAFVGEDGHREQEKHDEVDELHLVCSFKGADTKNKIALRERSQRSQGRGGGGGEIRQWLTSPFGVRNECGQQGDGQFQRAEHWKGLRKAKGRIDAEKRKKGALALFYPIHIQGKIDIHRFSPLHPLASAGLSLA